MAARGIVVLGMHRSGTSAVTRVLNLLGADVGPEEDLLTEYDNPGGHWENRALIGCNDRILDAFGRSWDFPPWLRPGWERSPRATALLPEMRSTFSEVFRNEPWVWKDPRTCLTLPLWKEAIGSDFVVVLMLRSPGFIVSSLRRRDGIPRFYAIGLWHHYLRAAVSSAAGLPTLCRHFEDMVADPKAFVDSLLSGLAELGLPLHGDPRRAAESIVTSTQPPMAAHQAFGRSTTAATRLLDGIPPTSSALEPPMWPEPLWIRPALTAYRATWMVRSRAGHPLRPRHHFAVRDG